MKKIFLLLMLTLLGISCVSRDNPFDPGAENFDEELILSEVMKFIPDTISNVNGTCIKLRSVNLSSSATTIHIEFNKHDLIIDSVNVIHNKSNALVTFNGNVLNINFTAGIPVVGTKDIANIYLSNLPVSGKLEYDGILLNDDVADDSQSEEVFVDSWKESVIE